jgi:hypothetical protein
MTLWPIMAQACMDSPPTDQLTLPLQHDGLGLAHTSYSLEEGNTTYLSAPPPSYAPRAHSVPPVGWPWRCTACGKPKWEAVHDKSDTLWRPELRVVSQDSMVTIVESRRTYCWHLTQAGAATLLISLYDSMENGQPAHVRLLSHACRPAMAWMDTLPLSRALELKSEEL